MQDLSGNHAPVTRVSNVHSQQFALLLAALLALSSCGSGSTDSLAERCDKTYSSLTAELELAVTAYQNGTPAGDVIQKSAARIELIAFDVPVLRKDLAEAGERHRWEWPPLVVSPAILRYEARIDGTGIGVAPHEWNDIDIDQLAEQSRRLPESLAALGDVGRETFRDLKWFCNRVVAATMPPVPDDVKDNLFYAFMAREMQAKRLEIMRAIETEEELEAYQAYLASFEMR